MDRRKVRFAEEYVLSGYNLVIAAEKAGYKNKSRSYRALLKDPQVQEAIQRFEEIRALEQEGLRKALDADAAEARRKLKEQAARLEEFLGNPALSESMVLRVEKLLKEIYVYLIDKAIPNPPQRMEHSGAAGGPIQIVTSGLNPEVYGSAGGETEA